MLDLSKLENVQHKYGKIIARCPACKEEGHDNKGEHLVIYPSGKFGCIMYPGEIGREHRKRIYKLVGVKNITHQIRNKKNLNLIELS